MIPDLGDIVWYRGREGLQAVRAAIVTATQLTLDPRGVEAGEVPALDSLDHVHLHVVTPSAVGWFPEYNIPRFRGEDDVMQPGTWRFKPGSRVSPGSALAQATELLVKASDGATPELIQALNDVANTWLLVAQMLGQSRR